MGLHPDEKRAQPSRRGQRVLTAHSAHNRHVCTPGALTQGGCHQTTSTPGGKKIVAVHTARFSVAKRMHSGARDCTHHAPGGMGAVPEVSFFPAMSNMRGQGRAPHFHGTLVVARERLQKILPICPHILLTEAVHRVSRHPNPIWRGGAATNRDRVAPPGHLSWNDIVLGVNDYTMPQHGHLAIRRRTNRKGATG